jgi:HD-GYP domain-containing protein (c-di-GMP phosphodiesterase class II)
VPLKAERKILGVMGVTRDKPGQPFDAEDQTFLQNLADRVAQAIVNARLFTSAQRRAKHLEALNEIGNVVLSNLDLRLALPQILVHVQACLNVDAADVLLLGRHSHMLTYAAGRGFRTDALKQTYLRLGEGNAGRAALDRQVVNIPDLRADSGSFMRAPLFESEGFAAYYAAPLIAKGQVKGVLEVFLRGPFAADAEWLAFFHTLAAQTAIVIDSAALFADLQGSIADLHLAYDATIEGWSRALDLRDKETEGHTQRVTDVTIRLARAFGLSEGEILHIRRGALLHDIGKLGVPDAILHKPGQLTDDEWVQMREHPQFAYDMLAPITYLKPALDIPYCHHEKWDGTGYPRGLKGEQIPLAARLFAVVDVWDALRSDRPYRQGWPEDRVREHIHEQVGKHFDPRIAEMFLKLIESSSIMGLAGKE